MNKSLLEITKHRDFWIYNTIFIIINFFVAMLFHSFSLFSVLTLYSIIGLITLNKVNSLKICKLVVIVYFVFILFSLLVYYNYIELNGIPYNGIFNDDRVNELTAEYLLANNIKTIGGIEQQYLTLYDNYLPNHNSKLYLLFLSCLINIGNFFGEYHTFSLRVINIWFIIFSGLLLYKIGEKNNIKTYLLKLMFMFYCLFPNIIYISSHIYRDSLTTLIFVGFVYISELFFKKRNKINILVMICLYYAMYYLRKDFILIFVIINIIQAGVFLFCLKLKKHSVIILCFTTLLFILVFSQYINDFVNYFFTNRIALSDGNMQKVVMEIPFLPFGIIVRSLFYLIIPFSKSIFDLSTYFTNINNFINHYLTFGTILITLLYIFPIYYIYKKKFSIYIVYAIIIFFAIVSTTMGFRHVMAFYPFLILLIFFGVNKFVDDFILNKNKKEKQ